MKSAGVVFRNDGEFLFSFTHQDPTTGASCSFPVHPGWVVALFDPSELSEGEMQRLLRYPSLDQLSGVLGDDRLFVSEMAYEPEPGWVYLFCPGRSTLARVRHDDLGLMDPLPVDEVQIRPIEAGQIRWKGRRAW